MYRVGRHNAADVLSRQLNYVNSVEKDSCLFMLQSESKAMRTVTPESLKSPKGKPNKADYVEHINNMSTSVGYKLIIRDEFKMNWYELSESSMREAQ